jgi:hypothetical protein
MGLKYSRVTGARDAKGAMRAIAAWHPCCVIRIEEALLSTRTYSILASVIGTAVGAWWWRRHRSASTSAPARDNGTVIYHNTPAASALSGEGVI